ncbi:hypothetical protein HDU93_002141 [Gonapodya sp. JEL0774]|nr:hypothetical protein HDU93_002141 [Gonapodya sp. JEL0774]
MDASRPPTLFVAGSTSHTGLALLHWLHSQDARNFASSRQAPIQTSTAAAAVPKPLSNLSGLSGLGRLGSHSHGSVAAPVLATTNVTVTATPVLSNGTTTDAPSTSTVSNDSGNSVSEKGLPLRIIAGYNQVSKAHVLQNLKYVERAVHIDYDHPDTIDEAFHRLGPIDYLFIVPVQSNNRVQYLSALLEAALRHRRVRYLVLLSTLPSRRVSSSISQTTPEFLYQTESREMERLVGRAAIPYTVLRCPPFHHSLVPIVERAVKDACQDSGLGIATVRLPMRDGTFAPLDVRDMAEIAGKLFLEYPSVHMNKALELTGPDLLSGVQLVSQISTGIAHPIRFAALPLADFAKVIFATGIARTPREVETICGYFETVARGEWAYTTPEVKNWTGRRATPLRSYFVEMKQMFDGIIAQERPVPSPQVGPTPEETGNTIAPASPVSAPSGVPPPPYTARRPSLGISIGVNIPSSLQRSGSASSFGPLSGFTPQTPSVIPSSYPSFGASVGATSAVTGGPIVGSPVTTTFNPAALHQMTEPNMERAPDGESFPTKMTPSEWSRKYLVSGGGTWVPGSSRPRLHRRSTLSSTSGPDSRIATTFYGYVPDRGATPTNAASLHDLASKVTNATEEVEKKGKGGLVAGYLDDDDDDDSFVDGDDVKAKF